MERYEDAGTINVGTGQEVTIAELAAPQYGLKKGLQSMYRRAVERGSLRPGDEKFLLLLPGASEIPSLSLFLPGVPGPADHSADANFSDQTLPAFVVLASGLRQNNDFDVTS